MISYLLSTLTLLSGLLSALAAPQRDGTFPLPSIPGSQSTTPPGFTINSLSAVGTGCPHGTIYYLFNPEKSALTVTFSEYFVEAGPTIPIASNQRSCRLTIAADVPLGFIFKVSSVDHRGYYQLDKDVVASHDSIQSFQGIVSQDIARGVLVGPLEGRDYTLRDYIDIPSTVSSPCGGSTVLNIQSDSRVNNSKNTEGSGYIAKDSLEVTGLAITYNFQWQTCTKFL